MTATEPKTDCVYYGWDLSEDGKTMYCREAYTSAEAVVNHLNNAGATVGEMIEVWTELKQLEVICTRRTLSSRSLALHLVLPIVSIPWVSILATLII